MFARFVPVGVPFLDAGMRLAWKAMTQTHPWLIDRHKCSDNRDWLAPVQEYLNNLSYSLFYWGLSQWKKSVGGYYYLLRLQTFFTSFIPLVNVLHISLLPTSSPFNQCKTLHFIFYCFNFKYILLFLNSSTLYLCWFLNFVDFFFIII